MPRGIYEEIECSVGKHPIFSPQRHQSEVLDYFLNKSKYKGLLLFHRLGSGKSCSSIMISDEMLGVSKVKKVYVMTPGSLRQNFIEEYCEKCGKSPKYLKKHYTFITTNFSVGKRLPNFDGSLVIIDEVHNLMNGVKNQSIHSTLIYNALMKSNCRILALTGTPVYNYIWEWPFIGNLLKPGAFPNLLKNGELDTEAFMKQFEVDKDGNVTAKNKDMFNVMLRGIISYFPGVSGGFYPEVIYETPIQVRMTAAQDTAYWFLFTWEERVRGRGPPDKSILRTKPKEYWDKTQEYIMASKYIMSRLGSNFFYPKEFRSSKNSESRDEISHIGKIIKYRYKPTGEVADNKKYFADKLYKFELERERVGKVKWGEKELKELSLKIKEKVSNDVKKNVIQENTMQNIGWVDHKNFGDKKLTDIYSRKLVAVITNVLSNWKAKHVIFTFFKTKAGVNIIHSLFKMCGIKTEIYSGDISDGRRREILKKFNAENNRYGDKIKILLVTEAGAEGINILEAQHMHILESSTREMKVQQAIGRVVRYKSHMVDGRKPMPKTEQVVHVWRYWSTSGPDPFNLVSEIKKKDGSTEKITTVIVDKTAVDEILYNKGRVFVNSLKSFLNMLKNASVTSFDKSQDKDSSLKDYGILHINPLIENACKISDERYNAYTHVTDDTESVIKDFMDVTDEAGEPSHKKGIRRSKGKEDEEKEEEGGLIQVIPSKFVSKNKKGDFEWMINQKEYKDVLFIFNDNEEDFLSESCIKGAGNAVIRPYKCKDPPRAAGIPTGFYKKGSINKGYDELTDEVKEIIDVSFEKIEELLSTGNYKRVIYSGTKNDLGTSIFKVGDDVRKYIIKRLYMLENLEI